MRLDNYLVNIGLFDSRTKAKQAIERKEIFINSKCIDKSSYIIDENLQYVVEKKALKQFVSLGGYKLDKALDDFNYSVENHVVADIGASTGGFTDCLLQRGASKVYCVAAYIVSAYMRLTRDEAFAIRYHMGFSGTEDPGNVGRALEMFPLAYATCCADMEAAFLMEGKLAGETK